MVVRLSASEAGLLERLIQGLNDLISTKYSNVAALTFLLYDHLITLPLEVQCFWNRNWSIGKALYLITRFTAITLLTGFTIIANTSVTSELCVSTIQLDDIPDSSPYSCQIFLSVHVAVMLLLIYFAGGKAFQLHEYTLKCLTAFLVAILSLRVYAVYEHSKVVLCISLGSCISASIVASAIAFHFIPTAKSLATLHMPGCFPSTSTRLFALSVVPSIVNECIQLILMVYKVWRSSSLLNNSHILRVLVRDSIIYFLGMMLILVVNLVIWTSVRASLLLSGVGWLIALRASLAGRLLMNIKDSVRVAARHSRQSSAQSTRRLILRWSSSHESIPLDGVIAGRERCCESV